MTNHSIIRTEERAHKNEKSAKRMINLAKERGMSASEFPSRERKYLESKEICGRRAVFYTGYCFIFENDYNCITMFPVPKWFDKKTNYLNKERIRHIKKYVRNNPDVYEWKENYYIA